jgi:AcrR family transcriptional regulator
MRRLASELGIQAPSLYKHVPDKAALEAEIIAEGLRELGDAFAAGGGDIAAQARAYRRFALGHPHLYALMTAQPLPRELLPDGLEQEIGRPILAATGDEHLARAAWAAADGLASLEIAQRFPADADLGAAWEAMVRAFTRASARRSRRTDALRG